MHILSQKITTHNFQFSKKKKKKVLTQTAGTICWRQVYSPNLISRSNLKSRLY